MPQNSIKLALIIGLLCMGPSLVVAQENASIIRKDETCQTASFIPEYHRKFRKLSDDKLDTVRMIPTARLITSETYSHFPERVYAKDGNIITSLTVQPNGEISDFERLATASAAVEICTFDPLRSGLPITQDGLKWDIEMDIMFVEVSGEHAMETLRDGLKDGRAHYKKVAGALSFVVPKMTHLMIKSIGGTPALRPVAMKDGEVLPALTVATFCGEDMISMKELESKGAHKLIIQGGSYRLMPVPNEKALARFAGCDVEN